jgi:hypothetical protein
VEKLNIGEFFKDANGTLNLVVAVGSGGEVDALVEISGWDDQPAWSGSRWLGVLNRAHQNIISQEQVAKEYPELWEQIADLPPFDAKPPELKDGDFFTFNSERLGVIQQQLGYVIRNQGFGDIKIRKLVDARTDKWSAEQTFHASQMPSVRIEEITRSYPELNPPWMLPPASCTKRAYIELFIGEGTSCICQAYAAEQYEAHDPDIRDKPLFTAEAGDPTGDAEDGKLCAQCQQEATQMVTGWLWRHDHVSATWGEQVYGEGKPSWATKDTYEFGDDPTLPTSRKRGRPPKAQASTPPPAPETKEGKTVSTPSTPAPEEKRIPKVGEYYLLSNGSVVYVTRDTTDPKNGGITSGYCSTKYQVPGTQNQQPLFTQAILVDITSTSTLLTEEDFKAQFHWLVKPLDYRKANTDLTIEDVEKVLTLQAAEKILTALEAKPEYIAEVDEVKRLAPEWLKANGDLVTFQSDLKTAEKAFKQAAQLYNTTKEERNRIDMQLGRRWHNLKKLVPTAQWSAWLTAKAQAIAPGIGTDEIIKQLKLFEDYDPVQPELRDELIALGAKPTKTTLEMVKQVLAEMPALTEEARQKVADLGSNPTEVPSDEAKKKLSEMAAAVVQRTKSKVQSIRSAAGAKGGAGNKAPATPPHTAASQPQPVQVTAEKWVRTTYTVVAEAVSHVAEDDATDLLIDLIGRVLGCGMGIQNAITISPSGPLYGFPRFTYATTVAKLAETAKKHLAEQRKPVAKETLENRPSQEGEAS